MKISRIPNFGSFGVYVDDIDMDHMTEEQWQEIGKLFVKELLVVLRGVNISKLQYSEWITKFGPMQSIIRPYFFAKYGDRFDSRDPSTWNILDHGDYLFIKGRHKTIEELTPTRRVERICGHIDEEGDPLGYFSSGEVHWHSNEGSSLTFAPAVALLGWEHMENSATCFVQTADAYESVSESFRSELEDMVLIHRHKTGNVNDIEHANPAIEMNVKLTFCPIDGRGTPMVCTAPNGRRGLHYTTNTRDYIQGMTYEESQKVFDQLDKLVFDKRYIYEHWYPANQHDLLLFDNSITLHKRIGNYQGKDKSTHPDRVGFRTQFTVGPLLDSPWRPWQHSPEWDREYRQEINDMINLVGGDMAARGNIPPLL
jgi:alpha-ketoglutarate-dependent taurine dioxygenase